MNSTIFGKPKNSTEKLADLREELNWFYSCLNRADESEIINLQTEAGNREKQITDLMRQIESINLSRDNFDRQSANEPENLKHLQKSLGERKALSENRQRTAEAGMMRQRQTI